MAQLTLEHVTKLYGNQEVVSDISLTVENGEFMVLAGPSGCGKSTLLRMIAGLEDCDRGDILMDGRRINDVAPKDRDIAIVFQNYALYPHMTAFENMAFGLRIKGKDKREILDRVRQASDILHISDLLDRKPGKMSGGQKQRVAIGRAIVREPKIFLFDEPLSNLDAALRTQMRYEIASLHKRLNSTILYVTHDQVEAMTLADRITILQKGQHQQTGRPTDIYHKPSNQFVAGFVGSPSMNFLPGNFIREERDIYFQADQLPIRWPVIFEGEIPQGRILAGIRPEDISLSSPVSSFAVVPAYITHGEWLGYEGIAYGKVGMDDWKIRIHTHQEADIRGTTKGYIHLQRCHYFDADTKARIL